MPDSHILSESLPRENHWSAVFILIKIIFPSSEMHKVKVKVKVAFRDLSKILKKRKKRKVNNIRASVPRF